MSSSLQDSLDTQEGLVDSELTVAETGADAVVHELEISEVDYSTFNKKDFARELKTLSQEPDILQADRKFRALKPALEELREQEKEAAIQKFISEGGKAEDFTMRRDEDDLIIDGAIKLIREKRIRFNREQEESRKVNLEKKEALLVRLRELVEGNEPSVAFKKFKEIQGEWRSIGAVPQAFNKEIWARYHALVDRFFDNRHIYLELLDLDRKKNLESKIELCIKAERLVVMDATVTIAHLLKEINLLHEEWKHIGPVPREDKDTVWNRFKAASDSIYERRALHLKEVVTQLKNNYTAKLELVEKIKNLKDFNSDSIKEWNKFSKEVKSIQELWQTIGPVERSKSRDLNREFWSLIKTFYNRRNQFFKTLDLIRKENLAKKRALIDQVNALKDLSDLTAAIEQVKAIQQEWKKIGSVPNKLADKLFAEFKSACDYFFEVRRNSIAASEQAQLENFREKQSIISDLSGLSGSDQIDRFKELLVKLNSIGPVPKQHLQEIRQSLQNALNSFISSLPDGSDLKEKVSLELELLTSGSDPDAGRRIREKEQTLSRKLNVLENELAVLKNNLEFFARSKNADAVRKEFGEKIAAAEAEIKSIKMKLKLLRSIS